MSERHTSGRIVACSALTVMCALGSFDVADAQETAVLKRQADSIAALFRVRDRAWKDHRRLDSVRTRVQPVSADQRALEINGVTVVADTVIAALAEHSAREALEQLQEIYGSGVAALSSESWILELDDPRDKNGQRIRQRMHAGYRTLGENNQVEEGGATTARSREAITDFWRRRADVVMRRAMDSAAYAWLGRSLGTGEARRKSTEQVFRELAIGENSFAPDCYKRELHACRMGLAMERGDRIGGAFSAAARASLLRLAFETGGSEAYARFMADTNQSIATRIEAAAKTPVDTLVGRWLTTTLEGRPEPTAASLPTAIFALIWSSILCVVSLRSSRWR